MGLVPSMYGPVCVNDRNDEHCGLFLSGSASEWLEPFSYL